MKISDNFIQTMIGIRAKKPKASARRIKELIAQYELEDTEITKEFIVGFEYAVTLVAERLREERDTMPERSALSECDKDVIPLQKEQSYRQGREGSGKQAGIPSGCHKCPEMSNDGYCGKANRDVADDNLMALEYIPAFCPLYNGREISVASGFVPMD